MSINTKITNVIEFLEKCLTTPVTIKFVSTTTEANELNFDAKYELPEVEAELEEIKIELPEICCELQEVTFALAA
ncbi:hypothetical protein IKU74_02145 [bacterium]|nr:hypothetical protein [bacterium]